MDVSDYYGTSPDKSHVYDSRNTPNRNDFVRAYRLLEEDLILIFDYIDPTDSNASTHSHRIYQLLLRACTEFEANAKEILEANGYTKPRPLNITDYYKLEAACRLSEYGVMTPAWSGPRRIFEPFKEWQNTAEYKPLKWYRAYNASKHNRTSSFSSANFENMINAVASVLIVLFAQYHTQAFDPYHHVGMYHQDDNDGFLSHSNALLHIRMPYGWTNEEKYDFDWQQLKNESNPFQDYQF